MRNWNDEESVLTNRLPAAPEVPEETDQNHDGARPKQEDHQ